MAAVPWQDRQPVALPPALLGERVQPHGPADHPLGQADHVDGRRVVVVSVTVVAGPAASVKESLFFDEDPVTDAEMRGELRSGGRGPAHQARGLTGRC